MILRVCSTPGACVDMNGSEQVSKTAVLTDSASDIPRELEEKYGIDILPFSIVVDGQSYAERVDFTNEQYYEMLTKAEGIPKTSQITMLRFLEKFCAYADEGYTDVIFVSINSAGSNTYNAACMAAESLRDERPGCTMNVHVVDSHTYSMTYGWHVCEAARKLQAGADVKSVVEYLEDQLARMEIMLSMYTLRFVKKERPCLCGSRIRRRAARPAPHHPYGGRHHLHHRQGARRQRRDARAHRPDQKTDGRGHALSHRRNGRWQRQNAGQDVQKRIRLCAGRHFPAGSGRRHEHRPQCRGHRIPG